MENSIEGGHIRRWYGPGLDLQKLFILCTWIYSEPFGQSQNVHLNIFFIYCMKSFDLIDALTFMIELTTAVVGGGVGELLAYSVAGIPSGTDDFSILGSFLFPSLLLVFSRKGKHSYFLFYFDVLTPSTYAELKVLFQIPVLQGFCLIVFQAFETNYKSNTRVSGFMLDI